MERGTKQKTPLRLAPWGSLQSIAPGWNTRLFTFHPNRTTNRAFGQEPPRVNHRSGSCRPISRGSFLMASKTQRKNEHRGRALAAAVGVETNYTSGRVYCDKDVPPDVYEDRMAAESKGRFMRAAIIEAYPYHHGPC
ncbi:MAG: KTSC domain-containing protein [Caldilineae bacterium]|nr:MAG: KTSC domain-containing protein [Caldilineae bacterium]